MAEPGRCLTSKHLRNALWVAADGRCQICGVPLTPGWHADHVIPWSETRTTNVHEMQALCAHCNLSKGDSRVELRAHQKALWAAVREVRAGTTNLKRIWALVTPGGGKSLLPVIAASELLGTVADKICWVVPRVPLQEQAAQAFLDPRFRTLLKHSHSVREATNDIDPTRGTSGYVTTYQALGVGGRINSDEFRRYRYVLVLDEPHHLGDEAAWASSVTDLVERAVLTIFMTGTLERGDNQKIAFMPYRTENGLLRPDPESDSQARTIRYTRQQAIHDRAILRMHVTRVDCRAEWTARDGDQRTVASVAGAGAETRSALWTALNTGFADHLLSQTLDHWRAHRRTNPTAKLLVVAPSVHRAMQYAKRLRDMGVPSEVATYEDSAEAAAAIRRFKTTACDVLVTVQMAYEGLDVPAISHIACLTAIRSKPWIEQMLARSTRPAPAPAPPWERQVAYIFAPDDTLLTQNIDAILAEQEAALRDLKPREPSEREPGSERNEIVPQDSEATRTRAHSGEDGETDYDETAQLLRAAESAGITGFSPLQLRQFVEAMGWVEAAIDDDDRPAEQAPLLTAKQVERNFLSKIQDHASRVDRARGWPHGQANKEIYRRFKKSRTEMSASQLSEVWAWVTRNLPL